MCLDVIEVFKPQCIHSWHGQTGCCGDDHCRCQWKYSKFTLVSRNWSSLGAILLRSLQRQARDIGGHLHNCCDGVDWSKRPAVCSFLQPVLHTSSEQSFGISFRPAVHSNAKRYCSTGQVCVLAGRIQQAKRCCYIASSSWAPGPCCGQRRLSTRAQKNYLNGNKWEIMKKQFLRLMANRLLSVWLRKRDCNITPMSLERHGSFYLSLGVTLTWHIPCSCCLRSQLKLTRLQPEVNRQIRATIETPSEATSFGDCNSTHYAHWRFRVAQ